MTPTATLFESIESTSRAAVTSLELAIDIEEHDRRCRTGLVAVTSRELLGDLMTLPLGMEVAESALDEAALKRLWRCAPGIVDATDGNLVRRLTPPTRILTATIAANSWKAALRSLNLLAAHTERHVVLPDDELADPLVRYSAERFGIGVWSCEGNQVSPAEPFVRQRFTPTGWAFTERAYERWRLAR